MNSKTAIQIFITGGTFDKTYNYISGELYFNETHLPDMLKRSRSRLNVDFKTLMMKDSLQMDMNDIDLIVSECRNCPYQRIIITHGTDTMVRTASALANAQLEDKTIILTGAMIPYEFGHSSDGFFNLGCALAFVQTLKQGVFVTMQGQYFLWDEVEKNRELGLFERIKK